MKKIVHIIGDLSIGGTERALFTLLTNSHNQEFKNYVIVLTGKGYFLDELKNAGIRVFALNLNSFFTSPLKLFNLILLVHKIKPDILQGWMYHSNMIVLLLKYTFIRKPIIFWNIRQSLYSLVNEKKTTVIVIKVLKIFSPFVEKIIYNSNTSKIHHQDFGFSSASSFVIPNGFNTEIWKFNEKNRKEIRNRLKIDENELVLGYVGRFHKIKNIGLLLNALIPIMNSHLNLKVVFIGKDLDNNNPFFKKFDNYLPKNKILKLGICNNISHYLSAFDAFCLCSNSEAFPNVLGEAMSSSLFCISSNVGDVPYILGDTGLIFPNNDMNALRNAIEYWIKNHQALKVKGKMARHRIEDLFKTEFTANQYTALYLNK